jgi:hypothetical protein
MIIAVADNTRRPSTPFRASKWAGRNRRQLDAWLTRARLKRKAWLAGVYATKPLRDTLESRVNGRGANLQA